MPEEDPVVPERLAERITLLLPHTTKIILTEHTREGTRVVNTVYLDGDEEASDVYTVLKAAADAHATELGRSGKYRAQIWRYLPGKVDAERHVVTFRVRMEDEDEGEAADAQERQDRSTGWKDLVEHYHRFSEFIAEYNHRATDRVLEQSKQDAERLNPMADVLHDFVGMYRDGLRMKADSVHEVSELRVRQQLAEAQAQDSGKMWEMLGPAMQVAAMHAGQRLLGGGPPKPKALPPGKATVPVPRRQGEEATIATHTAPTTPPADAPRSSPPASPASVESPYSPPAVLHELAAAVLDSMGTETLMRLARQLDDEQVAYLEAISRARDDDSSAEAIGGLMQSLIANPPMVVALQQALSQDQAAALQQIAVLARRHMDQRNAERTEGASPSSGDAPPAGKDAGS